MWLKVVTLALALVIGTCCPLALAQSTTQENALKFEMDLVWIPESKEYFFKIGGIGFKSLASLKDFLGKQKPGTVVQWNPGCRRMGNEPLLSSPEEMEAFKSFLEEKGVHLVLIPSG